MATFDLGLLPGADPGWFRVTDLDDRIYAARYSRADPTLAPPGHELIQISAACAPDQRKADTERRVLQLLDHACPVWRPRVCWQRGTIRADCTGALDLPGTTWHDRPPIDRGNQLTIATDQSAAPGLLAETGIAAAQLAIQQTGTKPSRHPARSPV